MREALSRSAPPLAGASAVAVLRPTGPCYGSLGRSPPQADGGPGMQRGKTRKAHRAALMELVARPYGTGTIVLSAPGAALGASLRDRLRSTPGCLSAGPSGLMAKEEKRNGVASQRGGCTSRQRACEAPLSSESRAGKGHPLRSEQAISCNPFA